MPMDLLTASPKQVANYLLSHRFENDASETATFLLQVLDQLPNMEEVSAQLLEDSNGAKGDDNEQQRASKDDLGEPHILPLPMEHKDETTESPQTPTPPSRDMIVSAITPRVKFKMSIHESGVTFTSPKEEEIIITANACAVQHVIFFPKREDCLQKPKINNEERRVLIPGSMVLLILVEDKVSFRKKSLTQICFQLPQHYSDPIPVDASMALVSEEDVSQASLALEEEEVRLVCVDSFEGQIMKLLKSALQLENIYRVYNPKYNNVAELQDYTFQSDDGGANQSIMQGKMPYLKCYHGVNDGVIYPMEEGLLFFKPPFFVHRSRLHSIAVGRGGGSRYVDLQAVVDGEEGDDEKELIEFTNIDREEMQVLNTYIHNVLVKAMARDIAGDGEGEEEQDLEKADLTSDSGTEGPSRKRYRRAASLEASEVIRRKLTKKSGNSQQDEEEEDDDDDDEYQADLKGIEEEEEDDDDDAEDDDDDGDDEHGEEEEENESDATVSEEED